MSGEKVMFLKYKVNVSGENVRSFEYKVKM